MYRYVPFMPLEVNESISDLKKGKSAGNNNVNTEHFIYASDMISVYLYILVNAMIIYGQVPSKLIDTILISLVKDKKSNVTDKDNIWPIAV